MNHELYYGLGAIEDGKLLVSGLAENLCELFAGWVTSHYVPVNGAYEYGLIVHHDKARDVKIVVYQNQPEHITWKSDKLYTKWKMNHDLSVNA